MCNFVVTKKWYARVSILSEELKWRAVHGAPNKPCKHVVEHFARSDARPEITGNSSIFPFNQFSKYISSCQAFNTSWVEDYITWSRFGCFQDKNWVLSLHLEIFRIKTQSLPYIWMFLALGLGSYPIFGCFQDKDWVLALYLNVFRIKSGLLSYIWMISGLGLGSCHIFRCFHD